MDREALVRHGHMVDTKFMVSASVVMVVGVKSVKSSNVWYS